MRDDDDAPSGRCARCQEALLPEEVDGPNPETRGYCITCVPRDLHVPPPIPFDPNAMEGDLDFMSALFEALD